MKKFKKITVIAHRKEAEEIVFSLMKLKCVSLSDISEEFGTLFSADTEDITAKKDALNLKAEKISRAYGYLCGGERKTDKSEKINADFNKFISEKIDEKAWFAVEQAIEADKRKREIFSEIDELKKSAAKIESYLDYSLPLGLKQTASTRIFFGTLSVKSDLNVIGKKLYSAGAIADNYRTDTYGIYICVFCHLSDEAAVGAVLAEAGFNEARFEDGLDTAPKVHGVLTRKIAALTEEAGRISDKEKALADGINSIKILYDIEYSRLNYLGYTEKLGYSKDTVLINGYYFSHFEDAVSSTLNSFECAYEFRELEKTDKQPVYEKKLVGANDKKSLEKIDAFQDKNKIIFLPILMSERFTDISTEV